LQASTAFFGKQNISFCLNGHCWHSATTPLMPKSLHSGHDVDQKTRRKETRQLRALLLATENTGYCEMHPMRSRAVQSS